jgi:hypothetical protein
MLYAYLTHRIKWRSKWSLLFSHVTIRLTSQGCGIGFGVVGFSNPDLFLAYLILGAEGYFSLVRAAPVFLSVPRCLNYTRRSYAPSAFSSPGTNTTSLATHHGSNRVLKIRTRLLPMPPHGTPGSLGSSSFPSVCWPVYRDYSTTPTTQW